MTKLFAKAALLPGGLARDVVVEIAEGRILSVLTGQSPDGADENYGLLIPAVGNLHSHAFQRAMAGLAERRGKGDDTFWSWRSVMYKMALSMTPDDVEAIAAQLYVEMLEAGFCRVGEFHYLHHDKDGSPYANIAEMGERIAAASAETGIGLTLLPVFYAHGGFGPTAPGADQRRFINSVDGYGALMSASRSAIAGLDGATIGIAPHSLRAATVDEIRTIFPLADGGPVHIHISEQVLEVEGSLAAFGQRPVELLLGELPVDQNWCLIHATHLDAAEVSGIARSGAVVGLCPITEANLGDGIFAGVPFLQEQGRFGIGSDSNVSISLSGELRQFEYSQRLGNRIRNAVAPPGGSSGQALLERAAVGGAQALDWQSGIAPGLPADLVSLDVSRVGYVPALDQLDAWIFGDDVSVDDVWVMGRKRVAGGRHPGREQIRRRFEDVMARLMSA
ncbi:MAG: formimidoylglutamate deiminase [Candidatus Devosia phytovorans]|uniref:Formimidoylglutamate deiminase n=1 Tax=Candidatus Devosia phytovorans TaxID=3121372 RepID=A0AAJ5VWV4_9HYPH|nr:formimidoylglutamate deiminase [Devosia sp.]WEK04923.1 MAG: formimidoylglutamate deiminase [Devosia sp.]